MAAHEIKFIKSGKLLTVEEGDSIVTSANNQGMDLPFSCMQGMCTTCMAKLVEGEIEYIEAPDKDALNAEDISNMNSCSSVCLVRRFLIKTLAINTHIAR